MRHTTLISMFALPALIGCSSSSKTVETLPGATQTTRISGSQTAPMAVRTNPTISRGTVMVDATPANTWKALTAAYDSLGIPLSNTGQGDGVLGNLGFKVRRKLKDAPLSRYLDCGTTQVAPNAESYEITLSIASQVQGVAGGTRVVTTVEASGRPIAFAGSQVSCVSTGRLEALIADLIGGRPVT